MEKRHLMRVNNKLGQITIFVIIAIILVAAIGGYFLVKSGIFASIPQSMTPIYDYYKTCIQQVAGDGANIMGSQGGYIYPQDLEFSPGSEYAPFSNQLDFMGMGIPYWYYISGNGIKKEQVPSKKQMQEQLARYIDEEINKKCAFSDFESQGFSVEIENISSVKTIISNNKISVSLSQKMTITKGEETFTITNHKAEANSRLGELYNSAMNIYDYEMKNSFLENYSIDVLYTYAPVEGTLLNCSPVVWSPYDVVNKLKNALNANIGMLKVNGDYYSLKNAGSSYFVVGKDGSLKVDNKQVSFAYSPDWPSRFEVWPTENSLMIAKPIGTQPGLSAMKFCYAPYKFVYDMYFPVLIQVYSKDDANEVFQFPVAVVINKNMPREAANSSETIENQESICGKANADITINTYNVNLEPVEASLEFRCLTESCSVGKTIIENNSDTASVNVKLPQCVNGFIVANAPGYREKKYMISTNEETTADIVLDREYNLNLEIYLDGRLSNDNSILMITESSEDNNFVDSISYPFTKNIKLAEGNYSFELKVYKSGEVIISATTTKQCVNVPRGGVLGFFGLEEEKCYDIDIPSQKLTNLPLAGGYVNQYITPSELENANIFRVYATSVKTPTNLDEIQSSYDDIENKKITLEII